MHFRLGMPSIANMSIFTSTWQGYWYNELWHYIMIHINGRKQALRILKLWINNPKLRIQNRDVAGLNQNCKYVWKIVQKLYIIRSIFWKKKSFMVLKFCAMLSVPVHQPKSIQKSRLRDFAVHRLKKTRNFWLGAMSLLTSTMILFKTEDAKQLAVLFHQRRIEASVIPFCIWYRLLKWHASQRQVTGADSLNCNFEIFHTLVRRTDKTCKMHACMQPNFLKNMENSDVLHGKILQNFSALCKILAKTACDMENFWKILHGLRIQFDIFGSRTSFPSSKLRLES